MTREQLLILLVLAFVLLINFAARVLRRWVTGKAPRRMEPEASQSPPRGPRLPLPVAQPRRVREGPQGTLSPVAVAPYVARWRPRSRLGSPREVRRGIVLMTILGPCRALEPADPVH
jgi:hypothetical protein